jgi:hypothetical protein
MYFTLHMAPLLKNDSKYHLHLNNGWWTVTQVGYQDWNNISIICGCVLIIRDGWYMVSESSMLSPQDFAPNQFHPYCKRSPWQASLLRHYIQLILRRHLLLNHFPTKILHLHFPMHTHLVLKLLTLHAPQNVKSGELICNVFVPTPVHFLELLQGLLLCKITRCNVQGFLLFCMLHVHALIYNKLNTK